MTIHHLNCGTMRPYGIPRLDGTGGFFGRGNGVIHCLLVETNGGLVLVDTGWGVRDHTHPATVVRQFFDLGACRRDPEETAVRQIAKLGYDPADVRHILLTHIHLDHAGGLPDFPAAQIHLSEPELAACLHPRGYMEHFAYRSEHVAHAPSWQPHPVHGGKWFGLDCSPVIPIGGVDFVLIPLTGHTRGHCAVAVREGGRWLMHCGDAYGYFRQVDPVQPYRYPNGRLMEAIVTAGFNMPRRHWTTLRKLFAGHPDEIRHFCSHDVHEFLAVK